MSDMEMIIGYINHINILIKRMTTEEYKFKPVWKIHFILRGLLLMYSRIITIIRTQAEVTLEFMKSTLLQHKSSIINSNTSVDSRCNSLLFTNTQPQPKSSVGVAMSPPQGNHPLHTGKKKDCCPKGGNNHSSSPSGATGLNKDQQQ